MIALIDCNSFYVSCERVFDLTARNRPVIVLSNNDGCVISRSDEAKKAGIPMGIPFFKAKNLIKKHNVKVFSSNYTLYGDLSYRVMETLKTFSPKVEVYSIDEAFLDLSGFKKNEINNYLINIKESVYKNTGIPVSIGLSKSKVLAKLANHKAKKEEHAKGVMILLGEDEIDKALKTFPVSDIWGIGRKMNLKLHELKLRTAYDFKNYGNDKLIQRKFTKVGRSIQDELRGISCLKLETITKNKKQIISSRSFGQKISNKKDIKEAVASHVTKACEKLRRQQSTAGYLNVFIQTNRFSGSNQAYDSKSFKFLSPTQSTIKMIKEAMKIVDELFREGFKYHKCGVCLSDIYDQNESQYDLFSFGDTEKEIELMKSMDSINKYFGGESLKSAACGTEKHWQMLSRMKSKAYTTRLSEILEIF